MSSPDEITFAALRAYGLSDGEVRTLMALIELGQEEPKDIASKAEVKQPKVYGYLNSLVEKEMVTKVEIEGKPNRYEAHVESVISQIDKYLEDTTMQINSAKHHLENLKSKRQVFPEFIRIFQGERAVITGISEILHEADHTVLVFVNPEFEVQVNKVLTDIKRIRPELNTQVLQIMNLFGTFKTLAEQMGVATPTVMQNVLQNKQLPMLLFVDPVMEELHAKSANFILPAADGMDPVIFHFRHQVVIKFQLMIFYLVSSIARNTSK